MAKKNLILTSTRADSTTATTNISDINPEVADSDAALFAASVASLSENTLTNIQKIETTEIKQATGNSSVPMFKINQTAGASIFTRRYAGDYVSNSGDGVFIGGDYNEQGHPDTIENSGDYCTIAPFRSNATNSGDNVFIKGQYDTINNSGDNVTVSVTGATITNSGDNVYLMRNFDYLNNTGNRVKNTVNGAANATLKNTGYECTLKCGSNSTVDNTGVACSIFAGATSTIDNASTATDCTITGTPTVTANNHADNCKLYFSYYPTISNDGNSCHITLAGYPSSIKNYGTDCTIASSRNSVTVDSYAKNCVISVYSGSSHLVTNYATASDCTIFSNSSNVNNYAPNCSIGNQSTSTLTNYGGNCTIFSNAKGTLTNYANNCSINSLDFAIDYGSGCTISNSITIHAHDSNTLIIPKPNSVESYITLYSDAANSTISIKADAVNSKSANAFVKAESGGHTFIFANNSDTTQMNKCTIQSYTATDTLNFDNLPVSLTFGNITGGKQATIKSIRTKEDSSTVASCNVLLKTLQAGDSITFADGTVTIVPA